MTVKELIAVLGHMAPDALVVVSRDSEGNGFSPLYEAVPTVYRAGPGWAGGEIGLAELTPELEQQGYSDADVISDGQAAVCLWPTR